MNKVDATSVLVLTISPEVYPKSLPLYEYVLKHAYQPFRFFVNGYMFLGQLGEVLIAKNPFLICTVSSSCDLWIMVKELTEVTKKVVVSNKNCTGLRVVDGGI